VRALALPAAALVALAACDQVFGLDRGTIDAPIDGAPITVSGRLTRTYLHNDITGAPATTSVIPDQPIARVGGVDVPLVWNGGDGTFSFTGDEGGAWTIRSGATEWFSRARDLELVDLVYGRPDLVRPTANTNLSYEVVSPAVSTLVNVHTTGVWSASTAVPASATRFLLDWTTAGYQGEQGLVDAARHDDLYFIWFALLGTGANTHLVASHAKRTRFTQVPGTTSSLAEALTPVNRNQCVHVEAAFEATRAKVSEVYPGGTSSVAAWVLHAVPRPDLGFTAALPIATANMTGEVDTDVVFGDPFIGLEHVLSLTGATTRIVDGRSIVSAYSHYLRPQIQATCAGTDNAFVGEPPMPIRPRLSGVLLVDGVTVGLAPDERPILSWELHGLAIADAYKVIVHEVTPAGALREVSRYLTTEPRIEIGLDDLHGGSTYEVHIRARTGVPRAAIGDFTQQTYPFTQGVYRAVFSVSREP